MGEKPNKPIRSAAVLGAGVMGAGIAAHLANAGIPVLLLDILPPNLDESDKNNPSARSSFAQNALAKLRKSKPAAAYHASNLRLISTGNLTDHLDQVATCDLVIEAIIERLDAKQQLFERLETLAQEHTIFASNTSGLRISDMLEGRSESFCARFLIMHFFNPPRYMKLLELVAGPKTSPAVFDRIAHFGREVLGKGIVIAKDSPMFIANRIGAHAMMAAIHLMQEHALSPEDVDAITGVPMAHPKSATFRTGDLVGIDTLTHVVDNCYAVLTEDEDREVFQAPAYMRAMVERKLLGNKTRGGFYRKRPGGIETLDPNTGEYRVRGGDQDIRKACKSIAKIEDPAERVRALVNTDGKAGTFAWRAIAKTLAYSARRLGEISDDIAAIDHGMRWGYNWELGPFQTWDALGVAETAQRMRTDGIALPDWVETMTTAGIPSFYTENSVYDPILKVYRKLNQDPREKKFATLRRGENPVLKNSGAEAWDLGNGILGLRFKTKANSIDSDVIAMLHDVVDRAETDFRAVVLANRGEHFCVGANLFLVVMAAQQKKWDQIRQIIQSFQQATQRMKYCQVPVVCAPYGMTLGGGLEICLGADKVQAAAETYTGLVEVGVGVIPGGAGTLNLLWRALDGIPEGTQYDVYAFVTQVFKNIAMAQVATSATHAKALGYFRQGDGVSFDRARQLYEAIQSAKALADAGYHPPIPRAYRLPGESGIATLKMMVNTLVAGGYATEHDGLIANQLATVLCGGIDGASGEVSEERMLELECEAFLSLCGEKKSQERMQHMLMKNKPLRN